MDAVSTALAILACERTRRTIKTRINLTFKRQFFFLAAVMIFCDLS
jgi:hypothetical protein